jgi:hypothetical protein
MDDRTARAKMLAQGQIVNAAERLLPSCTCRPGCVSGDPSIAIHPLIARQITTSPSSQPPGMDFPVPEPKRFRGSDKESSSKAASERRINVALMRR